MFKEQQYGGDMRKTPDKRLGHPRSIKDQQRKKPSSGLCQDTRLFHVSYCLHGKCLTSPFLHRKAKVFSAWAILHVRSSVLVSLG
ncbi:mCG146934 [Mus musculus]|nr:mCG146934 [Mus musculus]